MAKSADSSTKLCARLITYPVLILVAWFTTRVVIFRYEARVRAEIAEAAAISARDPAIQRIARSIRIISESGGSIDVARAVTITSLALNCWIEYDVNAGNIQTTDQMERVAKAQNRGIWRGDCKSQAVFACAILSSLNLPYTIHAEHRHLNFTGHAWVSCDGYDINCDWGIHPCPENFDSTKDFTGRRLLARLIILHQPQWRDFNLD